MKTAQLQIRLSPAQKALLQRRARHAGQDVSSYVLSRLVPDTALLFDGILAALAKCADRRYPLAALNDFLEELPPPGFEHAVAGGLPEGLSPLTCNLVAAMVERAAARKGADAPGWARDVLPLESPWFATDLPGLRAHLLRSSPTAFRRRNLFVDATVGDRV